jgi:nucleoside 2-deoxyribosyltransferase
MRKAMKKKVFISGPILGMENEQDYREVITNICAKLGFDVIDPWRRERALYEGDAQCWWARVPAQGFVKRDLNDAERCDVMVVYLPKLSAGACMELFYAKLKGKKVIVVSEMKCLSPWIVVHSDAIVKSLRELEHALKTV